MRIFGGVCNRSFAPPRDEITFRFRTLSPRYQTTITTSALFFLDRTPDPVRIATQAGVTVCGDVRDPEEVLRTYHETGEGFLSHLREEFALVLIDPARRKILAATDHLGLTPLYFAVIGEDFVWASVASLVAQHPEYRFAPDEFAIASFLFNLGGTSDRSFYAGIQRLGPGEQLEVTPGALTRRRYAIFEPQAANVTTLQDAAHGLRERLGTAIRRRHRNGKTAVLLSGGIDSAAIACLGATLGLDLKAFSLTFPGDPAADESGLIHEVTRRYALPVEKMPAEDLGDDWLNAPPDIYALPNVRMHAAQFRAMRAAGATVCFHGIGGDQLLAPDPFALRRNVISAVMPRPIRFLRRRAWGDSLLRAARWDFALRRRLWRLVEGPRRPRIASAAREAARHALLDGALQRTIEQMSLLAADFDLDLYSPYLDPNVVTYVLSLPPGIAFSSPPKLLLREAMRGIVPEAIRTRQEKAEFSRYFDAQMRRHAGHIRQTIEGEGPANPMLTPAARQRALQYLLSDSQTSGRWICSHWFNVHRWCRTATQGDFYGRERSESSR